MKKILLTLIVLLTSCLTVLAIPDDTGKWNFSIKPDGTAMLHGFTGEYRYQHTGDLVLPQYVTKDGVNYACTELAQAAFGDHTWINGTLTIPEGYVKIGADAFMRDRGLHGPLVLPSTLREMEDEVFAWCDGFTGDLIIPEGMTSIKEGVFFQCSGLNGRLVLPSTLQEIRYAAFHDCGNLTGDLIIPEGVTLIDSGAFTRCRNFDGRLQLPSTLKRIGKGAFQHCDNLKGDLIIPEGVEQIDRLAFSFCKSFDGRISLPSSLQTMGPGAFHHCDNLTGELIIPESITTIDTATFSFCAHLEKLVLPSQLRIIKEQAFTRCLSLGGGLTLPATVERVEGRAFMAVPNLTWVDATQVPPTAFEQVQTRSGRTPFAGLPACAIVYLPEGVKVGANEVNFVVGNQCERFVVFDKLTHSLTHLYDTNADYPILYPFTAKAARYYYRHAIDTNQRDTQLTDHDVYTHYLPYPTDVPQGADAYEINHTELSEKQIIFTRVEGELKAHTPYLIRLKADATTATYPTMENVTVLPTPTNPYERTDLRQPEAALGWQFVGTSMLQNNATAAAHRSYLLSTNKTWKPIRTSSTGGYIHAHRAFLIAPANYSYDYAPLAFLLDEHNAADLTAIQQTSQSLQAQQSDIYDLNGRFLGRDSSTLPAGLYLIGGKKVYKF